MSNEEFEEVYNEIFNSEEFLHLEQQYEEQYTQFENAGIIILLTVKTG